MRIVLDSNVLVRAAAMQDGPALALLKEIRDHPARVLLMSRFLLDEVRDVLGRPYFQNVRGVRSEQVDAYIRVLAAMRELVATPTIQGVVSADADDDPIVSLAVGGEADVICTWDKHFYRSEVIGFLNNYGIIVCKDTELLQRLRAEKSG